MDTKVRMLDFQKFVISTLLAILCVTPMIMIFNQWSHDQDKVAYQIHNVTMSSRNVSQYVDNLQPAIKYEAQKVANLMHQYQVAQVSQQKLSPNDANKLVNQLTTAKRIHRQLLAAQAKGDSRIFGYQLKLSELQNKVMHGGSLNADTSLSMVLLVAVGVFMCFIVMIIVM